jgi:hypothetical protein
MADADQEAAGGLPMEAPPPGRTDLGRRLLWFVGLWMAGVAAVTVVGLVIKLMLKG